MEEGTEDELLVLRRPMFDTDADGGRQKPLNSRATCWAEGQAGLGKKKIQGTSFNFITGEIEWSVPRLPTSSRLKMQFCGINQALLSTL